MWPRARKASTPPPARHIGAMPDGSAALTLQLHPGIAEIGPEDWDACAGPDNPFVSHAFLSALEDSGSAGPRTGWLPQHASLRDAAGRVVAVAPMYAKSHSYGEYVFDHGWANAFNRSGGDYYPKLQVAVPFSPVPGPRLLRRPGLAGEDLGATLGGGLIQVCQQLKLSSVHATFCTEQEWDTLAKAFSCMQAALASCSSVAFCTFSTADSVDICCACDRRLGRRIFTRCRSCMRGNWELALVPSKWAFTAFHP